MFVNPTIFKALRDVIIKRCFTKSELITQHTYLGINFRCFCTSRLEMHLLDGLGYSRSTDEESIRKRGEEKVMQVARYKPTTPGQEEWCLSATIAAHLKIWFIYQQSQMSACFEKPSESSYFSPSKPRS